MEDRLNVPHTVHEDEIPERRRPMRFRLERDDAPPAELSA